MRSSRSPGIAIRLAAADVVAGIAHDHDEFGGREAIAQLIEKPRQRRLFDDVVGESSAAPSRALRKGRTADQNRTNSVDEQRRDIERRVLPVASANSAAIAVVPTFLAQKYQRLAIDARQPF